MGSQQQIEVELVVYLGDRYLSISQLVDEAMLGGPDTQAIKAYVLKTFYRRLKDAHPESLAAWSWIQPMLKQAVGL